MLQNWTSHKCQKDDNLWDCLALLPELLGLTANVWKQMMENRQLVAFFCSQSRQSAGLSASDALDSVAKQCKKAT